MTRRDSLSLLGSLLICAAAGTYAFAQPKPAAPKPAVTAPAPAKPPPAAPASPAKANESASCPGCDHGMMKDMHGCPMMQDGAQLADATVENTKQGAVIRLTAKNAADVGKVQQLAQKLAKHITTGCDMHGHEGHDEHEGHGPHDHGHAHPDKH